MRTNSPKLAHKLTRREVLYGSAAAVAVSALPAQAGRPVAEMPELGPNVKLFTPAMSSAQIQGAIDSVYAEQQHSEFGNGRYAFVFLPGEYHVDVPVGFYTQVLGVGASPDDVRITGNVHSDAALHNDNATTTFWRGIEGFCITPTVQPMQWATSQACVVRRMHVRGDMVLNQRHGWSSGGWMADTRVDGTVNSGTQQQWISRNVDWKGWTGANWNMVFVGVTRPPAGEWPEPPYTKIARTPVIREKPFLTVDKQGKWGVRVPALSHDTVGPTWSAGSTPGRALPLSGFYIARPEHDSAETINRALAAGKHLLLTPGTYELTAPLRITRAGTVVLGLGYATLRPTRGTLAMQVDDVDGVSVAGILFDAGATQSPALLQVGEAGHSRSHRNSPIALFDVFFRVGGAAEGKVAANLVIHSHDVIVDHTWIWRADHGAGVGWEKNLSDNGLIVRGDDVTCYGLFVEHHQQYQVLWSGERGRTYFYQSEIPYDPPSQTAWTGPAGAKGWASYFVADTVHTHTAAGLGVYSVFTHPDIVLGAAILTPRAPGIHFEHMITVALDERGAILHVVDDAGESTSIHPRRTPKLTQFP